MLAKYSYKLSPKFFKHLYSLYANWPQLTHHIMCKITNVSNLICGIKFFFFGWSFCFIGSWDRGCCTSCTDRTFETILSWLGYHKCRDGETKDANKKETHTYLFERNSDKICMYATCQQLVHSNGESMKLKLQLIYTLFFCCGA